MATSCAARRPAASSEAVRRVLQNNRRRDTSPELALQRELHALGLRFLVPGVFVFDAPLLARLQLSGTRLMFLAQALAELDVEVRRGDPVGELAGRRLAGTHAPVPGFARRAGRLDVVVTHPWPWLVRPASGSLRSYSAWRKSHRGR